MDLLIDTTTYTAVIGLADGGVVLTKDQWNAEQKLAEELTSKIESLLAGVGKKLADLESIRVHAGPGGFSTLRIGVVTANTLAFSLGIPVEGVLGEQKTLEELLAASVSQEKGPIMPEYRFPPLITDSKQKNSR